MRRTIFLFVFVLIAATAIFAVTADKSIAAGKTAEYPTYKADLSSQEEVPVVEPAPASNPSGEATFQLGGKRMTGKGTGGVQESSAAEYGKKESSVASAPRERGVAPGPPDMNTDYYYKGIVDQARASRGAAGAAAGGTAGDVLHYRLNVNNIENVTAAHLHLGKKGTATADAPVIAPLYTGPEKTGMFNGTLAEGTITNKDLKGPLSGKTVQDLAKLIDEGKVFVNVHTAQNPAGEIRGEVAPK